jgi:hypothetical protein
MSWYVWGQRYFKICLRRYSWWPSQDQAITPVPSRITVCQNLPPHRYIDDTQLGGSPPGWASLPCVLDYRGNPSYGECCIWWANFERQGELAEAAKTMRAAQELACMLLKVNAAHAPAALAVSST